MEWLLLLRALHSGNLWPSGKASEGPHHGCGFLGHSACKDTVAAVHRSLSVLQHCVQNIHYTEFQGKGLIAHI
jgi:hypothetical protein